MYFKSCWYGLIKYNAPYFVYLMKPRISSSKVFQEILYKEVSYKAMLCECRARRVFICKHSDHDILNITFQKIYGTSAFIHHCVNGTKFALFYIFNNAETESCNLWQPRHSENNVSLYLHVIAYCFF